ncbi:hypothetical protein CDN99_19625 [Roseateles aquatilis]|uniref:GGDEF domain-containing protein n=1 Tax=Roseateles aquatilis TaxID=431061 RepID=A0A246J2T7_9BURK|nr:diguanylate cyclase [Roseateles aquatilis]OWQ86917.1 hypothetical protein CDN99_19625 [Roseateles aquatilis]
MGPLANPILRRIARVLRLSQAVAFAVVLAAAVALIAKAREYEDAIDQVEHTYAVLDQINQVRVTLLRGGVTLRNMALSPWSIPSSRLRTSIADANEATDQLIRLVKDNPRQSALAASVESEASVITDWYLECVTFAESYEFSDLHAAIEPHIATDGSRKLRALLDDMHAAEQALLAARQLRLSRELTTLKRWSIGLVGGFLAFMLWSVAYTTGLVRLGERNMVELTTRAETDPLTGLANRRALDRASLRLGNRAMSVVVFDLDKFKPVNDRHGHGVGDEVLKIVAGRLRRESRDGDVLARVGGDEFVLVFPDIADPSRMAQIAKRIETALSLPMDVDGLRIVIGASIGFATSDGTRDLQGLIDEADQMSYDVKKRRALSFASAGIARLSQHGDR